MDEGTVFQAVTMSPEMRARLAELEASWDRRLANQKQVIDNVSLRREAALHHIGELHAFLDELLSVGILSGQSELQARQLMRWEEP